MGLELIRRRGANFQKRRELKLRAEKLLPLLGISPSSDLVVLLTDDTEMTRLNTTYRNRHRTTDVLAFSQLESPAGGLHPEVLGDVVISIPTAKRQARQRKTSTLDEVTELLIHGVLHLLGYDHERTGRTTAAKMRKKQRELLTMITR